MKGLVHFPLLLLYLASYFFNGLADMTVPDELGRITATPDVKHLKRFIRELPVSTDVPTYSSPAPPAMKGFLDKPRDRREAKGVGGYMPTRKG